MVFLFFLVGVGGQQLVRLAPESAYLFRKPLGPMGHWPSAHEIAPGLPRGGATAKGRTFTAGADGEVSSYCHCQSLQATLSVNRLQAKGDDYFIKSTGRLPGALNME